MAISSMCENDPMEMVGTFGVYELSCRLCGAGNRFARTETFAPKAREVVTLEYCWQCLDHVEQIIVPNGCLVVWKDERKRRRTV
jgi:hypothetical protein